MIHDNTCFLLATSTAHAIPFSQAKNNIFPNVPYSVSTISTINLIIIHVVTATDLQFELGYPAVHAISPVSKN